MSVWRIKFQNLPKSYHANQKSVKLTDTKEPISTNGKVINDVKYAYDMVVIAITIEDLQHLLSRQNTTKN